MKRIKRFIGSEIWYLSESFNFSLGRFGPICLDWMIGSKGKRVD